MSFFNDIAFPWVHGVEGDYSDDPRDPGNWTGGDVGSGELKGTKYGISAASFPALDIRNLELSDAQRIAKRKYWDTFGGDTLPPAIALCVFDFGYNAGVHESVVVLQRAVGTAQDGDIGPATLAAIQQRGTSQTVIDFTRERINAYGRMRGYITYGPGWVDRANRTRDKALELC